MDNVFRWRFTSFTSKGPRHQGAVWRFNVIYKEQGTISIIELLAHKQNPLQSKQVFWTSCGFSASAPARALLSFIFKNPPPSPHDRPWSMRTTDAGLRLIHRVSAHRKRAPEIVDERPALLGMNCAMLRKLAGPRSARRAQRTHWRRMFGAQVITNPSHRCPSHVRLSPALVSAPPHVPVRPFVWGCGS